MSNNQDPSWIDKLLDRNPLFKKEIYLRIVQRIVSVQPLMQEATFKALQFDDFKMLFELMDFMVAPRAQYGAYIKSYQATMEFYLQYLMIVVQNLL